MANNTEPATEERTPLARPTDRRTFVKWTGVSAIALVAGACDEDTRTLVEVESPPPPPPPPPAPAAVTLNFANDFGVLNYAYALEQLEAAFYTQVTANAAFNTAFPSAAERQVLIDLRDHEVVHRDFLRAALGTNAIGSLTPNFDSIDFGSRLSVLTNARNFEDLGVGAYNGAGQFLASATFLGIAGKIVSVEARHASAIRDLLNPRSRDFAPRAFDDALPPQVVINTAAPFIRNSVTLSNVPTFVPSAYRA
ncbi:MAG: ferritin-like domain-containing protein [Gemmatimonadota bacterium]|nr:ferritin-like domain-containing protein [Gemmatimonadota bacterium]